MCVNGWMDKMEGWGIFDKNNDGWMDSIKNDGWMEKFDGYNNGWMEN